MIPLRILIKAVQKPLPRLKEQLNILQVHPRLQHLTRLKAARQAQANLAPLPQALLSHLRRHQPAQVHNPATYLTPVPAMT
jgi:hypothetical protein